MVKGDEIHGWRRFCRKKVSLFALLIVALFALIGLYAPLFASSKPLFVIYEGEWYFPLFRYLFYRGFFTKGIDLFYNVGMVTFPVALLSMAIFRGRSRRLSLYLIALLQVALVVKVMLFPLVDPATDLSLAKARQAAIKEGPLTWSQELSYLTPYARLNLLLRYRQRHAQQVRFERYREAFTAGEGKATLPTLYEGDRSHYESEKGRLLAIVSQGGPGAAAALAKIDYLVARQGWLASGHSMITNDIMPFFRPFHWEEDAGGQQSLNRYVSWVDLTRVNRKDLAASLIFGIRISLLVGLSAVALAILIGLPLGLAAGYYGGRIDLILSRLTEIWEAMPTFFMLLMVVAILQSRSIFLVMTVLGLFGWTHFARFIRAEVLRQRNLSYVEACHCAGFSNLRIMFNHILPNALPPLLTLLPFSVMAAITSEAALSFLGLGEAGTSSWGVLMDEGRSAFPAESYLLWPPALLLTILLIAIAVLGDRLRDALDPKSF